MSDPADVAAQVGGILGGGAGVAVLAKYIWESVKGRKDKLEEQAEEHAGKADEARDAKLDAVLAKLTALELDMRSLVEQLSSQAGIVAEVKARVEGISTNHGGRLGTVEQTLVELRTRIIALEGRKVRR